jgi:lactate dehydrogenase-like 2-hydroxyacid dehydrogenase
MTRDEPMGSRDAAWDRKAAVGPHALLGPTTRDRSTVAIVGMGHVGGSMAEIFPNAVRYDTHTNTAKRRRKWMPRQPCINAVSTAHNFRSHAPLRPTFSQVATALKSECFASRGFVGSSRTGAPSTGR